MFLGDGRIEDKKYRDERVRGNHHEKLELEKTSCATQLSVPDKAGMIPDPECNYTHSRSSQPNQASCNPAFTNPLVSYIWFSSVSPISVIIVHNSTIIAEHKVKSSLSICPCHDHELTPSPAYIEYSIHRIQHTPNTAYTQDIVSSLHFHDYKLTPECSFGFWGASLHHRPPSAISPCELKDKFTFPRLRVN